MTAFRALPDVRTGVIPKPSQFILLASALSVFGDLFQHRSDRHQENCIAARQKHFDWKPALHLPRFHFFAEEKLLMNPVIPRKPRPQAIMRSSDEGSAILHHRTPTSSPSLKRSCCGTSVISRRAPCHTPSQQRYTSGMTPPTINKTSPGNLSHSSTGFAPPVRYCRLRASK